MITSIEILLGGAALLLMLPVTVLFVETVLAAAPPALRPEKLGARGSVGIIVPAHDESAMIAGTLRCIVPQLAASDRLIVVADNCSDDTAAVAAASGAECIVRTDAGRRGKGYALDFGVRHLAPSPPDVVIVIDADCQVGAGAIDRLVRVCTLNARPVQALYLMRSPPNASLMTRIAEFAWAVKNQARPLGAARLGLSCQLMGTGMAFPWSSINGANLASGHIVEDLKLGIDLARARTPPLFCPGALVTSTFPASKEGIESQRTRWEHGHLGVIMRELPALYFDAIVNRDVQLLGVALDLSVPPLALLVLLVGTVGFGSLVFALLTSSRAPLWMAGADVVLFSVAVLLSWVRYGRRIISLGALALGVAYALWKIPVYAKFLVARQVNWVRSKRD